MTQAMKAALAIINSAVNPALLHDAVNVNAKNLADIIERETSVSVMLEALRFYADEKRYTTPLYDESDLNNVGMPFPDKGHKARAALAKAKEGGE